MNEENVNWQDTDKLLDTIEVSLNEIEEECAESPDTPLSDLVFTVSQINYVTSSLFPLSHIRNGNHFWNSLNKKFQTWLPKIMSILNALAGKIKPKSYTLTIGYPLAISLSVT